MAETKKTKKPVVKPKTKAAAKPKPKAKVVAKAKTKASSKGKGGRPTTYTKELADEICAKLATGDSMRTVCKDGKMPAMSTVFLWLRTHEEFSEQYARAKEEASDALVEEMIDIADDGSNDWMVVHRKDNYEGWQLNGEHVQRSKIRIETRKWIAAKLKPKKYGDKVDVTSGGKRIKQPPAIISPIKPRSK